jgi:hypothetical protein
MRVIMADEKCPDKENIDLKSVPKFKTIRIKAKIKSITKHKPRSVL